MEYAGYVQRNQPTDWSKVTGQVAQQLGAVEEKREAKREKLDTMLSETTALMGDVEMGESPEFNEVILDTTDRGRTRIYDAYKKMRAGEITPSQFTRIQSNMQASWGEFDTAVKQKNNRVAEIEKRTQEGTNGQREFWQNEQIAMMNDFSNHRVDWGEEGTLSYVQIDPKTGKVKPASGVSVSAINKTQNVFVDKFDVSTKVSKYSKTLGKFKDEIDGMTVGGTLAMPEYENTRDRIIGDVLGSNMNNYADALLDSSTDEYFLYKEGEDIPPGKEDLAIKMVMKDRQWIAEPNPEQKDKAKELVGKTIDDQVGYTRATATGVAKGSYKPKEIKEFQTAYELANDWATGKNLNQLVGSEAEKGLVASDPPPKMTPKGVVVTIVKKEGGKTVTEEILLGKDPKSLIKFGKYKTAVDAAVAYEQGESAYQKDTGNVYQGKEEKQELAEIKIADYSSDDWKETAKRYEAINDLDADSDEDQKIVMQKIKDEVQTILDNRYLDMGDKGLEFDFASKGLMGGFADYMVIKTPGGETKEVPIDFDNWANLGAKSPEELDVIFTDIANEYVTAYNKEVKNTSQGGASKFNKP
tara:strand:+ start:278 stop:2029 length:1752 start_codon:yes stop_codon:yes gene_type:complete